MMDTVLPFSPSRDGLEVESPRELSRRIIAGKDACFIDGDSAIESWIAEQKRVWHESRGELPPREESAPIPAPSRQSAAE